MDEDSRNPNSGTGTISIKEMNDTRVVAEIPPELDTTGGYSNLFGSLLKVCTIQRGKISCIVTVKPPIMNIYGVMHGGAVAAISELMATACARTLVGEEKNVILGEMNTSFLSSAPKEKRILIFRVLVLVSLFLMFGSSAMIQTSGLYSGFKTRDTKWLQLQTLSSESKVVVDGSVIRSGRNITVVAMEFKLEKPSKLIYTSQATLYHLPTASL